MTYVPSGALRPVLVIVSAAAADGWMDGADADDEDACAFRNTYTVCTVHSCGTVYRNEVGGGRLRPQKCH